jgi:hypothetical protein
VNSQLLTEYISTVLLPYIDELRPNEEFAEKEPVLLLDDCLIQVRSDTLEIVADHQVKVITFPPHPSHISVVRPWSVEIFEGSLSLWDQYPLIIQTDGCIVGSISNEVLFQ